MHKLCTIQNNTINNILSDNKSGILLLIQYLVSKPEEIIIQDLIQDKGFSNELFSKNQSNVNTSSRRGCPLEERLALK